MPEIDKLGAVVGGTAGTNDAGVPATRATGAATGRGAIGVGAATGAGAAGGGAAGAGMETGLGAVGVILIGAGAWAAGAAGMEIFGAPGEMGAGAVGGLGAIGAGWGAAAGTGIAWPGGTDEGTPINSWRISWLTNAEESSPHEGHTNCNVLPAISGVTSKATFAPQVHWIFIGCYGLGFRRTMPWVKPRAKGTWGGKKST